MMLRSLVDEVVRRRLWPIPVLAILIAIAAPLLFMKSAPEAAAPAAPPVAAPSKLPAPAERIMAANDKDVAPRDKSKRKGQDPFAPPASGAAKTASEVAAAPATTAAPATSTGATSPVVIRNSDGSTSTMAVPKATTTKKTTTTTKKPTSTKTTTKKKTTTTTTKKPTTPKVTKPKVTTPKVTTPDQTTSSAASRTSVPYVDVRFGKRMNTMIRYRVPRLQTFRAGGRVAAMFVHYSTTRNLAVFAVAPSTKVSGDVTCRKVKDVCRYVDIPAGSYARLRLLGENGSIVSRRLDVVSIRRLAGGEQPRPRETTLGAANCLLKGLLKLPASLPSIAADACG